jgi:hypothetical protein
MNFIKQVILIGILGAAVQNWFPWWSLIFPALFIGFVWAKSGVEAFLSGFIGIGLLWLGMALYIDITTSSMLSQKIAALFPGKSIWLLRSITVLVGGLTGGFASLTGYSIKPLR